MTAKTGRLFCPLILFFVMTVLFGVSQIYAADSDSAIFTEANQAYRDGKFEMALAQYLDLTEKYPEESLFLYNLGNAYYKVDQLGEAVLAYERALKQSPRNLDIRKNLNHVRGILEYKVEDTRGWYLKFLEKALEFFTEKEIAFVTLFSLLFFLISWNYVAFRHPGSSWGLIRKTALIVLVVCLVLSLGKYIQSRVVKGAVVMQTDVEVYYGPSESDQVAFRLGEGLRVYVIDQREDWNRIVLTSGESGWAHNDDIALIR